MSVRPTLDEAVNRLTAALDSFEAAIERRRASDETLRDLEDDVHLLALDRAKLARDLDEMTARAGDLATVNADVSLRLEAAISTVSEIIAEHGG